MEKNEQLKPFKIGSRVTGAPFLGKKRTTTQKKAQEMSAGFPIIEELIEKGDFEKFNQRYSQIIQQLERIVQNTQDKSLKEDALKSINTFQLTASLLEELVDIKNKMLESFKESK